MIFFSSDPGQISYFFPVTFYLFPPNYFPFWVTPTFITYSVLLWGLYPPLQSRLLDLIRAVTSSAIFGDIPYDPGLEVRRLLISRHFHIFLHFEQESHLLQHSIKYLEEIPNEYSVRVYKSSAFSNKVPTDETTDYDIVDHFSLEVL